MKKRIKAKRAEERLTHFACGACGKWWTIGDAPKQRTRWYCPCHYCTPSYWWPQQNDYD